jgi:Restriction endonuclease
MGEGAWSCFARLPSGLADQSVTLTLNWLRPKPAPAEFDLKLDEVEGPARRRNVRLRNLSVGLWALLALGLVVATGAEHTDQLALLDQPQTGIAAMWAAASLGLVAIALFTRTSVAEARYRRAEPRRFAYEEAVRKFAAIDTWRSTRAESVFWSAKLDETGFEREAAELLAGHFKTGQVMLTRSENDYGVDVLVCANRLRIVAQCKQWRGQRIGAADVRALAGAKAYFNADRALLLTLSGPTEDKEQCADIADAQNLELWDAAAIVAAARALQDD